MKTLCMLAIIFSYGLVLADQPKPAKDTEYPNPSPNKYRIVFRSTSGDVGDVEYFKILKNKKGKKLGSYPDITFYNNPELIGEPVYEVNSNGLTYGGKIICDNFVFCTDQIIRFYTDRVNDYPNNYLNEVYFEFEGYSRKGVIYTTYNGMKLYADVSSIEKSFQKKNWEEWERYGLDCFEKNKNCSYYYVHQPGRLIYNEFMGDHPVAKVAIEYVTNCLEKLDMDCADKKSEKESSIREYLASLNQTSEVRVRFANYKNDLNFPGVVDAFKGCLLEGIVYRRTTTPSSELVDDIVSKDLISMISAKKIVIAPELSAKVFCHVTVLKRRNHKTRQITSEVLGISYGGGVEYLKMFRGTN